MKGVPSLKSSTVYTTGSQKRHGNNHRPPLSSPQSRLSIESVIRPILFGAACMHASAPSTCGSTPGVFNHQSTTDQTPNSLLIHQSTDWNLGGWLISTSNYFFIIYSQGQEDPTQSITKQLGLQNAWAPPVLGMILHFISLPHTSLVASSAYPVPFSPPHAHRPHTAHGAGAGPSAPRSVGVGHVRAQQLHLIADRTSTHASTHTACPTAFHRKGPFFWEKRGKKKEWYFLGGKRHRRFGTEIKNASELSNDGASTAKTGSCSGFPPTRTQPDPLPPRRWRSPRFGAAAAPGGPAAGGHRRSA